MEGKGRLEQRAVLALRAVALVGFLIYGIQLVGNVAQTYDAIYPSYLGYYVKQQLLRPLLGMGVFVLLGLLARRMGHWLSRGLDG